MANPSPQPTPTSGVGTAVKIALSAAAQALVTIVAAREYSVTLSLTSTGFTNATTLTAVIQDVAGTTFTSGNSNAVSYKSYSPAQATVNASTGLITAVALGQTVVEARFPTYDNTDGIDFVFAQVLVTVVA